MNKCFEYDTVLGFNNGSISIKKLSDDGYVEITEEDILDMTAISNAKLIKKIVDNYNDGLEYVIEDLKNEGEENRIKHIKLDLIEID